MSAPAEPVFVTLKYQNQHIVVKLPSFPTFSALERLVFDYFQVRGKISLIFEEKNYLILSQARLQDLIDYGAFHGNKFLIEIEKEHMVCESTWKSWSDPLPTQPRPQVFNWEPKPYLPPTDSLTPQVHVFGSWSQPQN